MSPNPHYQFQDRYVRTGTLPPRQLEVFSVIKTLYTGDPVPISDVRDQVNVPMHRDFMCVIRGLHYRKYVQFSLSDLTVIPLK